MVVVVVVVVVMEEEKETRDSDTELRVGIIVARDNRDLSK